MFFFTIPAAATELYVAGKGTCSDIEDAACHVSDDDHTGQPYRAWRIAFRDKQTNVFLEQVPHRWGGISDVSIASLWADTMDRRGGRDRGLHIVCLNGFADVDSQSTHRLASSSHARAGVDVE